MIRRMREWRPLSTVLLCASLALAAEVVAMNGSRLRTIFVDSCYFTSLAER